MKSIVLTGGGTAGHVLPSIALLPDIKKHFNRIHYIGTNAIEKQILKNYSNIVFHEINTPKFKRKLSLSNLLIPHKLIKAISHCKKLLAEIKPNVVFSKGGYCAVPVVIAAHKLKIPVVSHESDLTFGLANKIIYHYCSVMCTSFSDTARKKKCVHTGSPINELLFNGNKNSIKKLKKFSNEKPFVLFFGGSLGAKAINHVVWDNIDAISKKYNVLHIVGKGNINQSIKKQNYYQTDFVTNINDFYALADFVVCRSGSNTIFELASLKKPMLLIPLPKDESRGDQVENAKYFEKQGLCHTQIQSTFSGETLLDALKRLTKDKVKLIKNLEKSDEAKPANANIVKVICDNALD